MNMAAFLGPGMLTAMSPSLFSWTKMAAFPRWSVRKLSTSTQVWEEIVISLCHSKWMQLWRRMGLVRAMKEQAVRQHRPLCGKHCVPLLLCIKIPLKMINGWDLYTVCLPCCWCNSRVSSSLPLILTLVFHLTGIQESSNGHVSVYQGRKAISLERVDSYYKRQIPYTGKVENSAEHSQWVANALPLWKASSSWFRCYVKSWLI